MKLFDVQKFYVTYELVKSRGHIHAHLLTKISTTEQFYMDQLYNSFNHIHNHRKKNRSVIYKCRYGIMNQDNVSTHDHVYNITMPIVNETRIRTYLLYYTSLSRSPHIPIPPPSDTSLSRSPRIPIPPPAVVYIIKGSDIINTPVIYESNSTYIHHSQMGWQEILSWNK